MQFLYDVIGSVVIGGIILLMLISFNASVMEGSAIQTFNSIVQSNVTTLTDLVEYDFRKMGYRVGSLHDSGIVYADTSKIVMKGDIDNNGSVERVTYYLDLVAKSGHVNPRSRILYRQINSAPAQQINMGVTRFRMQYYNAADSLMTGNPIARPSAIRAIRLAINLESTSPYDQTYAGTTWERTITPKNLK